MKHVGAMLAAFFLGASVLATTSANGAQGGLPEPSRPANPRKPLWTPVSWSGEPGVMQLYFVSRSSIRRQGAMVEFDALIVHETPTARGVEHVVERGRLICGARTAITLEQRHFGRGRQIYLIRPKPVAESFPKGSGWRIVIDSVCDNDLPAKQTDDPRNYAEAFFNA